MAKPDTLQNPPGTRQRILDAATKIFAEHGFSAVSIRDIASAADVALPTLYRHFADKRALYIEGYENLLQSRTAHYRQYLKADDVPKVKLLTFVHELYKDLSEHPSYARLLHRQIADQNAVDLRYLAGRAFNENFRLVTELCRELGAEQAPDKAAFSIFALAVGLTGLKTIGQAAGTLALEWSNSLVMSRHILGLVLPDVGWARVWVLRKQPRLSVAAAE